MSAVPRLVGLLRAGYKTCTAAIKYDEELSSKLRITAKRWAPGPLDGETIAAPTEPSNYTCCGRRVEIKLLRVTRSFTVECAPYIACQTGFGLPCVCGSPVLARLPSAVAHTAAMNAIAGHPPSHSHNPALAAPVHKALQ